MDFMGPCAIAALAESIRTHALCPYIFEITFEPESTVVPLASAVDWGADEGDAKVPRLVFRWSGMTALQLQIGVFFPVFFSRNENQPPRLGYIYKSLESLHLRNHRCALH